MQPFTGRCKNGSGSAFHFYDTSAGGDSIRVDRVILSRMALEPVADHLLDIFLAAANPVSHIACVAVDLSAGHGQDAFAGPGIIYLKTAVCSVIDQGITHFDGHWCAGAAGVVGIGDFDAGVMGESGIFLFISGA